MRIYPHLIVVIFSMLLCCSCTGSPQPNAAGTGSAAPQAAAPFVMPDNLPPITGNKELHFARAGDVLRLVTQKKYAELETLIDGWLRTRLDRDSRYNLEVFYRHAASMPDIGDRLDEWQQAFPQSHVPHLIRGAALIQQGWLPAGQAAGAGGQETGSPMDMARAELALAKTLRPDDPNCAAELLNIELSSGGDKAAMETLFAEVMALDPFHTPAWYVRFTFAMPDFDGSPEELRTVVDEATARGSYNPHLYLLLHEYHQTLYRNTEKTQRSRYYKNQAVQDEIIAHFDQAVAQFPDEFLLHAAYAKDLWACRLSEPAVREYARAADLADSGGYDYQNDGSDISFAETYNFYAWILATSPDDRLRNGPRALACAKKANALRPDWMYGLDTLGEAYAEVGDFKNAIICMKKAIALSDVPGMTSHMERNILLFEQGVPFRSRYY